MSRGPLEFVVIEFPDGVPGSTLGPELRDLMAKGVINLIDMLFVTRKQDGSVESFEVADRSGDEQFAALNLAAQSIDGLIAAQDVADVAAGLARGVTAGIFLFEHVWIGRVHGIVRDAGGEVVVTERIPGPVVEAIEALIAEGVSAPSN